MAGNKTSCPASLWGVGEPRARPWLAPKPVWANGGTAALRILVPEHKPAPSLVSPPGPTPQPPTGHSPRLLRHRHLVLLPGDDGRRQPFNVALKPSGPILLHHLRLRVQREACERWGRGWRDAGRGRGGAREREGAHTVKPTYTYARRSAHTDTWGGGTETQAGQIPANRDSWRDSKGIKSGDYWSDAGSEWIATPHA